MSDERVHPDARAFGSAADKYERGRPDYPQAAVEWLGEELEIGPGRTVLDLGAGTGKLTRQLVPLNARLIAVEPSTEMRAVLAESLPDVVAVDGTAEQIPLGDRTVDAIVVAQAFHWFTLPDALEEMARVLRPGGGLAVIWNVRDEHDPIQAWVYEEIEPLRGRARIRHENDPSAVLPESGLFGQVVHRTFDHRQVVDEDAFVERFMSVSFIAALPREEQDRVEGRLRERVADEPRPIVVPYRTEVYAARVT